MDKPETVNDYLDSVSDEARSKLEEMRKIIHEYAPKAEESISYGLIGYKLNGPLVYIGGFKKHVSLFAGNGSYVREHPELLEGYDTDKGTIRFPLERPLPTDLIKKLVKMRVEENSAKEK